MIFYILTVVAILAIVIMVMRDARDVGFAIFGIVVLWGFAACLVPSLAQADMPATRVESEALGLTALANRTDQPGGYFFLGAGVVDDEAIYRYVERDADGGNRMKDVRIDSAVVYEVDEDPHMRVVKSYGGHWWLTPWEVGSFGGPEYHFYIPEGSIAKSFEVKP